MLAPLFAFGHGVEFLLAKLEITPGQVRLEVTADCEGNYMLPDREAAMAAMTRLFVVAERAKSGGAEVVQPWTKLAPLRFEDRVELDPTVPLPPDPTWPDRSHRLVTGVWEWVPSPEHSFRFQVPKGEPIDTLLWRSDSGFTGQAARWRILISGDETEWIEPVAGKKRWQLIGMGVFAIAIGLTSWIRRRIRYPRSI